MKSEIKTQIIHLLKTNNSMKNQLVKSAWFMAAVVGAFTFSSCDKENEVVAPNAGKDVEVKCQFCNQAYRFTVQELSAILERGKRP